MFTVVIIRMKGRAGTFRFQFPILRKFDGNTQNRYMFLYRRFAAPSVGIFPCENDFPGPIEGFAVLISESAAQYSDELVIQLKTQCRNSLPPVI
jgi:hypothetical protein